DLILTKPKSLWLFSMNVYGVDCPRNALSLFLSRSNPMGNLKIPYLRIVPKLGYDLYFFEPSKKLRKAGFKNEGLGSDKATAVRIMEERHRQIAEWKHGRKDRYYSKNSFGWLVAEYKKDERYTGLKAKTRKGYDFYLLKLVDWAGPEQIKAITRKVCVEY